MKEKYLKSKILKYLNSLPETFAFTIEQRPGQSRGVSDIICCRAGKILCIEVKVPGNTPTALQEHFMKRINEAGGVAFWVNSMEQLDEKCF